MTSFSQVYGTLRRKNWRQYALLSGCCFFSVLLITAYVCMMRSPTILNVLPEGGDSRKQVMMVFVLAVIGCGMFTTYAAGLFFRNKSREVGVFLALGAARKQLKGELRKELALLSVLSCGTGALLGAPLAWALWQVFRTVVVDTQEMALTFDSKAYLLALAFSVFVICVLFFLGERSIRRTNIIDIVQESRKSEPIRAVPRWYGPVGILLLAAGGFLGYSAPGFFILVLHWYPPEVFSAIFYLPALVGLYMILLHTVVNGWSRKRNRYKDLIATSMMKFQGRQTVRNMLVMTVLIAGAYFASFYAPMLGTGMAYDGPVDYSYHWRSTKTFPNGKRWRPWPGSMMWTSPAGPWSPPLFWVWTALLMWRKRPALALPGRRSIGRYFVRQTCCLRALTTISPVRVLTWPPAPSPGLWTTPATATAGSAARPPA